MAVIEGKQRNLTGQSTAVFEYANWLFRLAIVIIFVSGMGIRLYDLTDAPLDFHPTRQLFSALKARGMYYQHLESAPEWQRELAVAQWKALDLVEPPVMERLSVMMYQLVGQEILWIPRIFAIVFWTLGGLGLLLLTREIAGKNGAIFSLAFYFFTPSLVYASRSFQPDPLMVALMIFALYGLVKWERTALLRWAIFAGLLAGLAIFVKTVAFFPLAAAYGAMFIAKHGVRASIKNRQVWMIAALAAIPSILFYVYGLLISGELQSQFSLRFFPQLWFTIEFWQGWNGNISRVIGLAFFLASILGIFMLPRKTDRLAVLGLYFGYFVYGLVLSHHISTHDYYQLLLVPAVAVGLAALFQKVVNLMEAPNWVNTFIVSAVILYFILVNGGDAGMELARRNYRSEIAAWQELSALLPPDASLVGITPDYGYRMQYWGWRPIANWLSSWDLSVRELAGQKIDMERWFREGIADHEFFVVTQLDELERQPVIKQLLEENFPVWQSGSDYVIYDLRNSRSP